MESSAVIVHSLITAMQPWLCSLVAIIVTVEPLSPEPCPQVHVCLQCITLRDK